ncbi:UvrD-helicase domain-containing protein [Alicyclobacillus tolerans]|uniref:Pyrimidine deaminase RibD-like protein n=1 Tax=Alicyclobacillus tolerans TaxID=90970 RepID=A0ABT9M040_9BACL|nr:pyrimidine deaminase RibD-like protein [Alicyclobacillus tengchongensis]
MLTEQILRNNLTENQYNAVVDNGRYILCLACAGSGKSRTLAYKIAYLVSQGKARGYRRVYVSLKPRNQVGQTPCCVGY